MQTQQKDVEDKFAQLKQYLHYEQGPREVKLKGGWQPLNSGVEATVMCGTSVRVQHIIYRIHKYWHNRAVPVLCTYRTGSERERTGRVSAQSHMNVRKIMQIDNSRSGQGA